MLHVLAWIVVLAPLVVVADRMRRAPEIVRAAVYAALIPVGVIGWLVA